MSQEVTRRCSCGCCRIVVTKWDGTNEFPPDYTIHMESSVDKVGFSFWNRLKTAFLLVFRKKVSHAELAFEDEKDFAEFVSECEDLLWKREEKDGIVE